MIIDSPHSDRTSLKRSNAGSKSYVDVVMISDDSESENDTLVKDTTRKEKAGKRKLVSLSWRPRYPDALPRDVVSPDERKINDWKGR